MAIAWRRVSRHVGDAIPDSRLRQHHPRVVGAYLDLLPQVADIDAKILGVRGMRRAPHGGEDLLVGHHHAGVPGEKRQQLGLLGRELDLLAGASHAMAHAVDLDVADLHHRRLGAPLHAVVQRHAHPRHQFADTERLVDVVVGAEVERVDLFHLAIARREDDDRHVRPFAHPPDHVLAVAVGQPEIEHDDIRHLRGDPFGRLGDGAGGRHLVVVGDERGLEKAQDRRLVVDDENADLAGHERDSMCGKTSTIRVPRPCATGLSAVIAPTWASMMPLAMARPRPVPSPPSPLIVAKGAPRTNFWKTWGSTSDAIPGPSSLTRSATRPGSTTASTTTRVSFWVCARTLLTTLPTACSISVSSARTSGNSAGRATSNCWAAPRRRTVRTVRSTISRKSIQSWRNSSTPASIRVIASRLRTMSSRPSASLLMLRSRSSRAAGSSLSA